VPRGLDNRAPTLVEGTGYSILAHPSAGRAEIETSEGGDVLVVPNCAEAVRVEVDRPHASGDRTLDVEPETVPDMDRALG
jgi:hypothetical protein